jgi:hypothetical protein
MPSSLPAEWIDRIFLRMQGVYGREFTAQFSVIDQTTGVDVGLENAKQVWAEELATFHDWPEAIGYALKNLPDRSPNIIRFRELCRQCGNRPQPVMLTHTVTKQEREQNKYSAKNALHELSKHFGSKKVDDKKDWARKLVENPFYDDRRPRSPACIKIAKQALGIDT